MSIPKTILCAACGAVILYVAFTIARSLVLMQVSFKISREAKPFSRTIAGATTSIVFIGDSTAVGTGSIDPKESIAGRFAALYPAASIVNEGVNGQKIGELDAEFDPAAHTTATALVIQIGGNDILRFTPISKVEKSLDSLLAKARGVSDQVVILHTGNVGSAPFFPRYLGWIWSRRALAFRALYMKKAAETGVTYIDLYQERTDDIFLTDPKKYYAPDYLHPSGEGYRIWFEKISAKLRL